MKKTLVSLALVAALVAPAIAQPPGGGTPPTPAEREARFVAADKNKDGKLDKAEWIASIPAERAAQADQIWSTRFDADGDGFVTKEQYLAVRMGPRGGGGAPPAGN
jgi:EF hand